MSKTMSTNDFTVTKFLKRQAATFLNSTSNYFKPN